MNADISDLLTRAQRGEPRALATLGWILLIGDGVPPSPERGVAYLREADRKGDGEATALLARMAAWGVYEPRNIDTALDLLQRAAERGWVPAQEELRFLARADGTNWEGLRQRVDVAALTTPPPKRVLSNTPRIRIMESFASPAECEWLIGRARKDLRRAEIYQNAVEHKISKVRTNSEADLTLSCVDIVTSLVRERIAAAAGVAPEFCEVAKVLHYQPGQYFGPHADFFDGATLPLREEVRLRGQRIATFLIYLNDDYEDGETHFLRSGLRHKGCKGDAVLFINVAASGAPDVESRHQGLPPRNGEKWVLSQWIRNKPINAFMTPDGGSAALDPNWLQDA